MVWAMKVVFALAAACALVPWVAGPAIPLVSGQSGQAAMVLRAGGSIDPASGRRIGPVTIRVRDGKIVELSDSASATTGALDLGTLTVMPGLIDAHVHLQIGGSAEANALAVLQAGFTTVVDLGATTDEVLRLRDRIAAGAAQGPRILAAGLWTGTKDGVCEFGGIGLAGGPPAFRQRVDDNVKAGADVIKVCVSGWAADALDHPSAYEIADDALEAATSEAHRLKRLVLAHAISLGAVKASLHARVDGLAHAAFLDAATAVEMKRQDMFMIPTLASLVAGAAAPVAAGLRAGVKNALEAGVRIVFGTDGGVLPHGRNAREFVALANAGIPPIEAIRAATINAAATFGLADLAKGMAVGAAADLIAVDGDPLSDPTAFSRVKFVMQGGRIVVKP